MHEQAARVFFDRLQEIDLHLSGRRFLTGATPAEADWPLLPSLIRLEGVHHGRFKLDGGRLVDYPNLCAYPATFIRGRTKPRLFDDRIGALRADVKHPQESLVTNLRGSSFASYTVRETNLQRRCDS